MDTVNIHVFLLKKYQLTFCLELLAVLSRWSICLLEDIFLLLKKKKKFLSLAL